MGLFGRDDRANGSNPDAAEGKPKQRQAAANGSNITMIAPSTHIEGEIKGAGEVRIEGTIKGRIDCSATVFIDRNGQVDGEIKGETVVVAGKIKGDIVGSQKLELTPTAEIEGDITSPRILIREGATFEGQVFMTGRKGSKKPEPAEKKEEPPKTEKNGSK
jgi:cytoskeletal protein CcmA (bactofilin family)